MLMHMLELYTQYVDAYLTVSGAAIVTVVEVWDVTCSLQHAR